MGAYHLLPAQAMTEIQSTAETDFNGIQLAPAPWKLKCRTWTLLISPLKSNKVDGKSLVSFPAGWAAPFECDALSEGEFVGGLGMVMVSKLPLSINSVM